MFPLRFRPLFVLALAVVLASSAFAQSTLIPLTARRDMVFDQSGNYLYISTVP
jgi:hypothetical protein